MDKEFAQFFEKANYEAQMKEYAEQTGYQRAVALQGIIAKGQFMLTGFDSVMQYANNPNFTPEQSKAALESGMQWLRETMDVNDAYWASVGSGPTGQPDYSQIPSGYPNWWDFGD